MADEKKTEERAASDKEQVALELMKFIAVTTGYGKGGTGTGFNREKGSRTAEEYTDALLELFERCRASVNKPVK